LCYGNEPNRTKFHQPGIFLKELLHPEKQLPLLQELGDASGQLVRAKVLRRQLLAKA